jgi:hypothetical protein
MQARVTRRGTAHGAPRERERPQLPGRLTDCWRRLRAIVGYWVMGERMEEGEMLSEEVRKGVGGEEGREGVQGKAVL